MSVLADVLPRDMEVGEFMKVIAVTIGLVSLGLCVVYFTRNKD